MFFGLFSKKVKVVKVKRKTKARKTQQKRRVKKSKTKKIKTKKRAVRVKKIKLVVKKAKIMPKVIGKVTHYFPHVKAGVILITNDNLVVGDTLQIKGHTTDFKQKVNSMQINNVPIQQAKPGQEVGLLVKSRVRHNDIVYKI